MDTPTQTAPARAFGHRALVNLLAVGLAALATGCGGVMARHDWQPQASLPPLPTAYLEVPAAELPRHCGTYSSGTLYGCAKRDFKRRVCTVVTGPQPAAWLLNHERKHCAGYDHGPDTPVGARTAALGPAPDQL